MQRWERETDIPADGVVAVLDGEWLIPGDAQPGQFRLWAEAISAQGEILSSSELSFFVPESADSL